MVRIGLTPSRVSGDNDAGRFFRRAGATPLPHGTQRLMQTLLSERRLWRGRRIHPESATIASGYFWFYAGVGAFTPYTALYYQYLGFSGIELGLLTALPALGTALTGPFWGMAADALSAHRAILRTVLAIAAVVSLALAQITSYLPFLLTLGILAFALVPVPSLMDSYAVSVAERGGHGYGVLRIFGSIGFTVMVLIMGAVMAGGMSNRFIYAYAVCHMLALGAVFLLPRLGERRPRKIMDGVGAIWSRKPFLLLLLVAYMMASGVAILNMYLGIHIRSLGSGTDVVGTAFAVSAMSELPVIGFGTLIMSRIGARRMIIIALVAYIVRFSMLAVAPDAGWVIASQLLHGLSFAMFLVASVNLAHRLVGGELAATAQALLGTMSFGFGNITGSLVGGALLDVLGTRTLYSGVVLLMAAALAVYVIGGRLLSAERYEPASERPASG